MQDSHAEVPQPFPREPGLARFGERKDVVTGNPAIVENPFAGADMPSGVSIAEQSVGATRQAKLHSERCNKSEIAQRGEETEEERGGRCCFRGCAHGQPELMR